MKTYLEAANYGTVRAHSPLTLVGLLLVCAASAIGLVALVGTLDSGVGPGVNVAGQTKLYEEPKPEPEHPLKKTFPELFATEAIVVTFSADWCAACRRQAVELRGPSARYNIIKVDIEVAGKKTKWAALMDRLKLGDRIPVTAVISKGEVVKVFYGYTRWGFIKPYAGKAKKSDGKNRNGNNRMGGKTHGRE